MNFEITDIIKTIEVEAKYKQIIKEFNSYDDFVDWLKIKDSEDWQQAYSTHPTHKPIALMEYLINMVTRQDAVVLDMFMGSGSTGVACMNLGLLIQRTKLPTRRLVSKFLPSLQLLVEMRGVKNER